MFDSLLRIQTSLEFGGFELEWCFLSQFDLDDTDL